MTVEWPRHRLDASELPDEGCAREFRVGGGDWPFRGIVLRRNGTYACFANVCPHQRHPLNLAGDDFLTPDADFLRCASHGALFDPATGECVDGPCVGAALTPLACTEEESGLTVIAPASLRDF